MKQLVSEFLWFQRYISDHGLETELEIENDKIIFRSEEALIEWDVAEARQIRTEVITDTKESYLYTKNVIKGRFELGESAISRNANYSYWYAGDVIKGRFELGEPAISKDAGYSYYYARDMIKGRFELGEPAIATNLVCLQQYQALLNHRMSVITDTTMNLVTQVPLETL